MTQQEFETQWRDANGYVVCHTSGSTGTPKEIHLDKEVMKASAARTNEFFKISARSRLHTCLDFKYIASKMMTVRADLAGCPLTSEIPSNRPLGDIGKDEVTLLSVVPSQMEWILDLPRMDNVRNILIGGSPIPSLLRKRIAMSGYQTWESYGMTETASHVALRRVEEDASNPFVTLPGIKVSLSAEGCLVISIPDMEDVVTNDLAQLHSDTSFLILGRADNCINSGGIKIMPEQLESQLGPFISFDYCISSLPDKKWGERLVLVVDKGECTLSDEIIAKAIAVRLNQFKKSLDPGVKTPKEIIVLRELPRTPNGKLNRNLLKSIISEY